MSEPTDDDFRRGAECMPGHPHLAGTVAQAIADERARCAKVVIESHDIPTDAETDAAWNLLWELAENLRNETVYQLRDRISRAIAIADGRAR